MKKLRQQILFGLIGASGGLAGMLPLMRCSGQCSACFGCSGIGISIIMILIGRKIRIKKGEM